MIPTIDQTRALNQLRDAITRASAILHPKLKTLLNPNVVDARIRLTLHLQNGDLKYMHDWDSHPGYVHDLVACEPDSEYLQATLKSCLKTVKNRLEERLGRGWHGAIILLVTICAGQATITSEADGVTRLDGK